MKRLLVERRGRQARATNASANLSSRSRWVKRAHVQRPKAKEKLSPQPLRAASPLSPNCNHPHLPYCVLKVTSRAIERCGHQSSQPCLRRGRLGRLSRRAQQPIRVRGITTSTIPGPQQPRLVLTSPCQRQPRRETLHDPVPRTSATRSPTQRQVLLHPHTLPSLRQPTKARARTIATNNTASASLDAPATKLTQSASAIPPLP